MTRWTEADIARLNRLPNRPRSAAAVRSDSNKYGAKYRVVDGIRFASHLESRLYEELKLRKAAGEVLWFIYQVPFLLEGGVIYRADFLAVLNLGGVEVWDAKGKDTPMSDLKRKQVLARYGVDVILWNDKSRR